MNFKDLIAYQRAKELKIKCEELNRKYGSILPKYYQDQLGRASLSVVLNIAEGSGRESVRDQRHYFVMANGSLREVDALIDCLCAFNSKIVFEVEEIIVLIRRVGLMLRGLINKRTI
jgi:four helix bundle protein